MHAYCLHLYFNRFIMKILHAQYVISSPEVGKCPASTLPEYAFIGRSNVGKSSLINMLCQHEKLAKTSASPGKTQLINHFTVDSATSEGKKKNGIWSICRDMVLPK